MRYVRERSRGWAPRAWTGRPIHGPLQRAGRIRRVAPFALLGIAVGTTYLARNTRTLDSSDVALLAGATALITAAMLLVPWEQLPDSVQVAVPMAWIVLVMLMQVVALPADIDVAILMLLPLVWTAAYGTTWEVTLVAGTVLVFIVALQVIAAITDEPIGLTGWTEVVGLVGGVLLVSYFTLSSRSEAHSDPLTDLPNRRAWDAILPLEMDVARRHAAPLAVGLIDLDDFKSFNDRHGHAKGDAHLVACAEAWPAVLRASDVLARVGGEEFAVLLPDADAAGAARVLERLAALTPGAETCSVGVAEWDGRDGPDALLSRADQALYAAKDAGRNRVHIAHGAPGKPGARPAGVSPSSSSSTPSAG